MLSPNEAQDDSSVIRESDVPLTNVGFTAIRLSFELDSDASEDQLATLLRLTERYCVVFQTLARSPALSVTRTNGVRD